MPNKTATLKIEGMTCAACAARLEKVLSKVPGVSAASVSLASEEAVVAGGALDDVIAAIRKAGFDAGRRTDDADRKDAPAQWGDLIVAFCLTAPLVGQMLFGLMVPLAVQAALATPVQFWVGRRFYRGAWGALKAGTGTMDVLVAMGTSAAYGLSMASLIWPMDSYFESGAVVITLVLLGRVLEARARHSAADAVTALMALRPDIAHVERAGVIVDVPSALVAVGDVVIARPGDRFPVDGTVISGDSQADESLVTGESMPVPKGPGDRILTGSTNGDGMLRIQTQAVGGQSTLGRMVALVREAQNSKAPVQKLVDRVSAVFVPVVLLIAVSTAVGWWMMGQGQAGIVAAIAVLVVACPCALGLATPAAIMVGVGLAARAGILVKGVGAFESASRATMVVFDKTGTLTEGKPSVEAFTVLAGQDGNRVLTLAASAQSGSEHPLGKAMVAEAERLGLALVPVERFTAVPGQGVEAQAAGETVLIGNESLLRDRGIVIPEGESSGIWICLNGRPAATVTLRDRIRPDAAQAVADLRALGVDVALLTGDRLSVAQAVGRALGIETIRADARPQDKAAYVAELGRRGQRPIMVGDGINDAPALKTAALGIAMGGGTDVALEVADMALLRPDPRLVPLAVRVSRRVVGKIRQNLFLAFLYNVLAIPFAVTGHMNPVIAGAAMALSSVSVVGNALLLRLSKVR